MYIVRPTFRPCGLGTLGPAGSGIKSVQLSRHFQPASDRDRVSPAMMLTIDLGLQTKRETCFSGICKVQIARGAY